MQLLSFACRRVCVCEAAPMVIEYGKPSELYDATEIRGAQECIKHRIHWKDPSVNQQADVVMQMKHGILGSCLTLHRLPMNLQRIVLHVQNVGNQRAKTFRYVLQCTQLHVMLRLLWFKALHIVCSDRMQL